MYNNNKVSFIQLLNGQTIIAKSTSYTYDSTLVLLEKPRVLILHQQNGQASMSMVPFGVPYIEAPEEVRIPVSAVLTIIPLSEIMKAGENPNKRLIEAYEAEISPIKKIPGIKGLNF